MPSLEWNKQVWGQTWAWERAGDEWSGMAAHCGQPYPKWKAALVESFLAPHAAERDVLEIAPGFGRWRAFIAAKAIRDISRHQREVHGGMPGTSRRSDHVNYASVTATTCRPRRQLDFVWSFDAFVHMDRAVIAAYLQRSVARCVLAAPP